MAFSQWKLGDTWYYTRSEEYMPSRFPPLMYDYLRMTVAKDSVFNNTTYQWLDVENPDACNPLRQGFFARYAEGKILIYNSVNQSEFTLYDFNLSAGDSLIFPLPDLPQYHVTMLITKVDSIEINGIYKRKQHVQLKAPAYVDAADKVFSSYPINEHYIIDDIGSTVNFFMAWDGLCHGKRAFNLRCFDSGGDRYHHNGWGRCDSIFFYEASGVASLDEGSLIVFPNPVRNYLKIKTSIQYDCLILYDLSKTALVNVTLSNSKEKIILPELKPGVYFLRLFYEDKLVATQKLIVNYD